MTKCPKCNNRKTFVRTSEGVLVVPFNNYKLSANELLYCEKCVTYFKKGKKESK